MSTSSSEWENLVKKQLKTENISDVLRKENLEGLEVRPYYSTVAKPLQNLPKIEESTQLVSQYHNDLDENVFAVLLNENAEGLEGKSVFINSDELAKHILAEEENVYYSLIDVFDEKSGKVNELLAKELLEKNFRRNICINVALHQNAGASISQQLGIALAKAKDLTEIFGAEVLSKLLFRMATGPVYFFEIAKIRALKLLFIELSKEFGKKETPYIFAETTFRNKAKNDEENNLIRSTLELASAMVGGADAVFSNSFKLENSTSLSEEISFKQGVVLAYESIVNVFDDGGNGSYFVEDLTQQICEKSWNYFLEIENAGGYSEAFGKGKIQNDVYTQAIKEQQWVAEGRIKLIGVNMYPKLEIIRTVKELYAADVLKPVRWAEMFEN